MEIEVSRKILESNDRLAEDNRRRWQEAGLFAINILSSPGAGKTTLLERTIKEASRRMRLAVIEGDIQTSRDAERVAAAGATAVQINTRGACHLDADMVGQAARGLDLDNLDLLIIENVGNLVCPAEFNLGEAAKVVVLSTPEGDDKPAKYPLAFRIADLVLINKIDLLPYLPFSLDRVRADIASVKPDLEVIELSALTGQGFEAWLDWLTQRTLKQA